MTWRFVGDEFWESYKRLPDYIRPEVRAIMARVLQNPIPIDRELGALPFKGFDYLGYTILFDEGRGILSFIPDGTTEILRGLPIVWDEEQE